MIADRPTDICRNCHSLNIVVSENSYLADFFAKRVFCIGSMPSNFEILTNYTNQIDSSLIKHMLKFILLVLSKKQKIKDYIHSHTPIQTECIICHDCGFIGPRAEISSNMLNNLYYDYRSDSYNFERCIYEPNYSLISSNVGAGPLEIENRLHNVDKIINKFIDTDKIFNVLDYGGGCGLFIPSSMKNKSVVIIDVSDQTLIDSQWCRFPKLDFSMTFEYGQLSHVLEHVPHPHLLLHDISKYISSGGYIYIEVPQDRNDDYMKYIYSQTPGFPHVIHEHINLYSAASVAALGKSVGLEEIYIEHKNIEIDWKIMPIISALFRKT